MLASEGAGGTGARHGQVRRNQTAECSTKELPMICDGIGIVQTPRFVLAAYNIHPL